jgi:hypothetical protein
MAISRGKKPAVLAGSHSTTTGCGARAPQRSSAQLTSKRKANDLASSGGSLEPANQRPEPSDGSAPLYPTAGNSCFPEGGVAYAAVLAGSGAPFQPSRPFKPTAMYSDQSESVVTPKTANVRMSSDMSGPLSDKSDGPTASAHVTNTGLPAGERPNKTLIFISGVRDTLAFLAWLRASCPGSLTAQLKDEKLMVVP